MTNKARQAIEMQFSLNLSHVGLLLKCIKTVEVCSVLYLCCDHLGLALGIWVLVTETQHHLVPGHGTAMLGIPLQLWKEGGSVQRVSHFISPQIISLPSNS